MPRTVTIASQKGGVGKTTTALNLGYSLGRMAGRTLVIDLDPQSGMTIAVNLRNHTDKGLVDILKKQCAPEDALAEARDGSITVLGIGRLEPSEMAWFEQTSWSGELGQALSSLSRDYQYTIIDCPAGVGGLVHACLGASQGAVLVCDCCPITLKSLPEFLKLVEHINQLTNPALRLDGVLLSMVDTRSSVQMQIFEEIQKTLPAEAFFQTIIPYNEQFEQASMDAAPAVLVDSSDTLNRLYLDLALELRERERAFTRKQMEADGPPRLF